MCCVCTSHITAHSLPSPPLPSPPLPFPQFPSPPLPSPISPEVPPNITMQPVAVTPNETTTRCCAGIRVFLTDPSDTTIVFTAQVSTDGTPFTIRPVTKEGDVVYVQGLQAGTPYDIRLTGRNQFGSITKEVSTTPLIGERGFVCSWVVLIP